MRGLYGLGSKMMVKKEEAESKQTRLRQARKRGRSEDGTGSKKEKNQLQEDGARWGRASLTLCPCGVWEHLARWAGHG